MNSKIILKAGFFGLLAAVILFAIYFLLVSFISGFSFALGQFIKYKYFLIALAVGFGIQVSLYIYLRTLIRAASKRVLATSGVTSAFAMISCCSHYLVNLLPIIGVSAVVSIIGQYQIELFWIGLVFNFLGILYMINRIGKYYKK